MSRYTEPSPGDVLKFCVRFAGLVIAGCSGWYGSVAGAICGLAFVVASVGCR